jgi:Family of unknown function (DUF6077)
MRPAVRWRKISIREGANPRVSRRLHTLETYVVVLSAVALVLLGPLRSAFAIFPLVIFSSTLLLFMVPGIVLVRWFFEEHISAAVGIPVSFTISLGIFALVGVPLLLLHQSLLLYLWVAYAIVAAAIAGAVIRVFYRKPSNQKGIPIGFSFDWLWVPFLLLGTAFASVSRIRAPLPDDDIWVYLAWVREFANADKLALREPYFGHRIGTSRAQIDGWLLNQAALSKVAGIDSVELVLRYLAPTLVVMSLLALYALARVLLKSETAALLTGSLYELGLLIHLGPTYDLVGRIAEDKFLSFFLFLPVGLIFALLFLESRKVRYVMIFTFLCWAVVAVHPVGLALLGLCTAGFDILYLATRLRDKGAWIRTLSLGAALNSVLVAPLLYLLATGESLVAMLKSADINYGDPAVLANMVFAKKGWQRVLELGDNYYMVNPERLLDPAILVAFFVGLPFLLWRMKRCLPAQLILGMLLVPTVVCFVPPVATFFGNHIVLPGQLWRLAWPIPSAAFLAVGWMIWELIGYAQTGLNSFGKSPRVAHFLPLMLVCALMVAVAPKEAEGEVKAVYHAIEGTERPSPCFDPVFDWIQDNVKKTSVVLAPDKENTCIPAYSTQANVVSLRGGLLLGALPALERRVPGQIEVPQGDLDVRSFYRRSTLEGKVRIIQRYELDYLIVQINSPLKRLLKNQPGLQPINIPSDQYVLYAVNRSKLRR